MIYSMYKNTPKAHETDYFDIYYLTYFGVY